MTLAEQAQVLIILATQAQDSQIKIIGGNRCLRTVLPAQAARMIRANASGLAVVRSASRVRKLLVTPGPEWQECWRNSGSAVLGLEWGGWLRGAV